MGFPILNVLCIITGFLTLGYSLAKATHERKFWRVQQGYYLHVTFDVVLYFVTGMLIVIYNAISLIKDYFSQTMMTVNGERPIAVGLIRSNESLLVGRGLPSESSC